MSIPGLSGKFGVEVASFDLAQYKLLLKSAG